jgi:hypothetical protein
MSEQAELVERREPKTAVEYTVQIEREVEIVTASSVGEVTKATSEALVWLDVATVSVPLRTKRRGIIAKALLDAGIRPEPGKPALRVRVLDEESAAVVEPEPFQPEAEWRIV